MALPIWKPPPWIQSNTGRSWRIKCGTICYLLSALFQSITIYYCHPFLSFGQCNVKKLFKSLDPGPGFRQNENVLATAVSMQYVHMTQCEMSLQVPFPPNLIYTFTWEKREHLFAVDPFRRSVHVQVQAVLADARGHPEHFEEDPGALLAGVRVGGGVKDDGPCFAPRFGLLRVGEAEVPYKRLLFKANSVCECFFCTYWLFGERNAQPGPLLSFRPCSDSPNAPSLR